MKQSTLQLPDKFFVTGTDTGIGKTVVSAILAAGMQYDYWKPIQAGLDEQTDTEFVRQYAGLPDAYIHDEQFRLQTPMSPHAAAEIDEVHISLEDFQLPECSGRNGIIVEGAGGLMVPINEEDMIIDLIAYLDLPVVLVASSKLGTLNHTFLSLRELRRRSIPCLGVVMNGEKHESNRRAIEHYGEVEVLAELESLISISPKDLIIAFETHFQR